MVTSSSTACVTRMVDPWPGAICAEVSNPTSICPSRLSKSVAPGVLPKVLMTGRVPGVEGVKTGFTSKAGRCLIAKVSQNGNDLLLVILNSNRRWNTARSLIDYGLRASETIE